MQGNLLEHDDLEPVGFEWSKLRQTKPDELAIRFGFGALVALVAGALGIIAGAKVGGLFLAFPAILPASLTLVEKKEGRAMAWANASGGVLGAVGMTAFAAIAAWALPFNPILALTGALVAWIVVAAGLYFLFRETGLFLVTDRLISHASTRRSGSGLKA